ncbi:amidase [Enteractinococcus fodinae]|uniref:Aspartyl-tRNA(Asn)/glutamyl-tRNA(Gln) amidotransferase subunit A n=1 Tax=Enteractinococcus fodinae TaxID=684663 RepID=A0ABU2AWQ0_9MICC|nr:amidase [Enteractinococcus fodinae]MDR7345779.1 aspartyl-tRNA(Asn)/glutamyl-tRNA(Gln) amidotransferase subunit A [Enteractinococcus fodinae]
MSSTFLPSSPLESLQMAQAEIGSGHNCFVYVPEQPLADEKADSLPLAGLPIAVKDVIDCQGMPTAAGSRFTALQPRSARLIDQLVAAGASVVGKTQAHQFSFGTTGDVSFAGAVRNAWDPSLMAGGSSGGSAVAVALGIVPAAVGTDTAGSIRIPAALNGVVGFKPTYGTLSSEGIFPLSPSLDTPGLVGRDVSTLVTVWEALHEVADDAQRPVRAHRPLRFGVLPSSSLTGMASRVESGLVHTLKRLDAKSNTLLETPHVDLEILRRLYLSIIGWEGSMIHDGLSRVAPELYDDEIRQRIGNLFGVTFEDYLTALNAAQQQRHELSELFQDYDVLVSPTLAIETPGIGQRTVQDDSGLEQVWGALAHFTSPWNVVGFPAITLPIPGAEQPIPIGLQLIGKPECDTALLSIAEQVEALLRGEIED